jgi:hypothetical protein
MSASDYQRTIQTRLGERFDDVLVEWSISRAATDAMAPDAAVYAPRVDVAVGPFNQQWVAVLVVVFGALELLSVGWNVARGEPWNERTLFDVIADAATREHWRANSLVTLSLTLLILEREMDPAPGNASASWATPGRARGGICG